MMDLLLLMKLNDLKMIRKYCVANVGVGDTYVRSSEEEEKVEVEAEIYIFSNRTSASELACLALAQSRDFSWRFPRTNSTTPY